MAKLTDTIILGDLIVTGKTHLKDDLTIDEQVTSDFIPDVDNSYDLGSAIKRFANVYATAVIVDGNITSVTSTASNTMTLGNSTNAASTTLVANGNSFQINVDSTLIMNVVDGTTDVDMYRDMRVRGSTPSIYLRPASDVQQGRINYEDAAGNLHGSIQYEPSGDYLRWYSSTTASEWWRFDSGGMTITNELEVGGNIISRGTGTQQLLVESTNAGLTQLYLRSNTRDWYIKNTEGINDLIFDIDGTDSFWMDGTNTRFGIGVDPVATIHAKSSTAEIRLQDTGVIDSVIATYSIYDNNSALIGYFGYGSSSNSDMTIFNNQAGDIAFYTAGVERFRIDNSLNHVLIGSLGIGDNSQAVSNLTGQGLVLSNNDGGATGRILLDVENITSGYNTRIAQNDTGFIFESTSNSRPLIFYTGSPLSEVVRIDTAGLDVIGNINVTSGDIFIGGNRVLTVNDEGSGGGIDADTLDGLTSSQFLRSDASDSTTGVITMSEAIFTDTDPYLSVNNNTKHLVLSGGTGWTSTAGTVTLRGISAGTNSGGVELRGADTGTRQLQISGFASHTIDGNTIWHGGNDGAGSGLDADLLDGVAGADYVLGNGTDNGTVTITANDVDFIVQDTTDATFNYIWRDHSAGLLYLGTDDAVVTLRSGLDANNYDVYDVNKMQVGNATSVIDANYGLYVYQLEDQNEDSNKMALYSRINIQGDVSNYTADRIRAAIYGYSYLNDNSVVADANVAQPTGLYGYAGAVKGHADNMYGVIGLSVASGGADTNVSNVYGGNFEARIDNPGTLVGTLIGAIGAVRVTTDADDPVTGNAVRGYINSDGGTIGTARYFYGNADVEVGGTVTTIYGLHLDMQNAMDGTVTNRRGIWLEGEPSYLTNSIGGRTYFGNAEGYVNPDSPWTIHVEDSTETLIALFQGSASGAFATFARSTSYAWDIGIDSGSDFIFRDNGDVTRLHLNFDMLPVVFDSVGMTSNGNYVFKAYDTWLRLNADNQFTSGVYFNLSQVRTDGHFRAGAQSSTFYPETLTLNNATANRHRLQIRGGGTGYTTADILLEDDSGQAARGMGMFAYNRNSGNEWFFGQPYNGSELEAGIYYSYQANGSEGAETANENNYIVEFNSSGQSLFQDGTSSLPAISFKTNPDTGFRLSSSEIIVGSDGNNVMGWSAGNINIYNNAVLNIDGTSRIDFDDRLSSDPGTSTLMSLGGVPIMKQVSDRGAIVFASRDDSLILGCGDVGNDFEAQISTETSENTWIVSDGSVHLQSGLQSGYSTTNQVVFNSSGVMTIGGNTVWHAGNDGSGSGLDADLLDGVQGSSYLRSDATDTATGVITFNEGFHLANARAYHTPEYSHSYTTVSGTQYIRLGRINNGVHKLWISNMGNSGFQGECVEFHNSYSNVGTNNTHPGVVINRRSSHTSSGEFKSYYAEYVTQQTADIWVEYDAVADHTIYWRFEGQSSAGGFTEQTTSSTGTAPCDVAEEMFFTNNSHTYVNNGILYRDNSSVTFDPPGAAADTAVDVALAMESGNRIVGTNDGSIRSLLDWTASSDILIGQNGTSLISGIDLRPGSSGVAKVNGSTIWHTGNDGSGSGLDADLLDGLEGSAYAKLSGATFTGRVAQSTSGFHVATKNDITTRTDSGFWQTATATLAEGWPEESNSWAHLLTSTHSSDGNYYSMQFAGDFYNSNDVFYRATNNNGSASWNRIWHAGNDGSGSGLDADTLDGYQASDFPRKSEAATITGGWTFDTNISIAASHYINHNTTASRDKIRVWNSSTYSIGMDNAMSFGNLNDYAMTFQMNDDSDRGFWWGHSGHTDAQGAMSLTTHGELTVDRRITINGSSTGFNPTVNSDAALKLAGPYGGGITFTDTNVAKIWVQSSGNEMHFSTGGGTSYEMKIDNSGNFTAVGNVTAYSDETLKDVKNLLDRPELLDNLEVFDFDWKDGRGSSIGPLAQRVQRDAPELINTDVDTGILSLDYGKYAVALAYEEKKKREQAEIEINKLRDEVDELKDLVRQLLKNKNSK